MTASLLGASFEGFVLDNEMHSHTYRALRGIEVTEENLGFEAICQSVLGDGHFLGSSHTYEAMERDYFYPRLGDRLQPALWSELGAWEIRTKAEQQVRETLDRHRPRYIDAATDAGIRTRFNILLD